MKFVFTFIFMMAISLTAQADLSVADLQVNLESNPMSVESETPTFSWRLASSGSDAAQQKTFSIKVTSESGDIVWDSGKVEKGDSINIPYAGKKLSPTTKYNWTVTVVTEKGQPVSGKSSFETGFMVAGNKEWAGAKWIGGGKEDLVFYSSYLSVFKINFDIQLDKKSNSTRAAFLYGGNDFRLKNKNFNIKHIENDINYIALELDVSGVAANGGNAKLNVFRVGYTTTDTSDKPLVSLIIPTELINEANKFAKHSVLVESVFGQTTIHVNGVSEAHLLGKLNKDFPFEGFNINPYAFDGGLKPQGNPADYLAFPMVGEIGFGVKPGQKALFSNVVISNVRSPSNTLFAAASENSAKYQEIFVVDKKNTSNIQLVKKQGYQVSAKESEFLVLSDPSRLSAPMLRKEFSLNKEIKKARLYVTARGIYEMYINGERVGDDVFAPGLTQYNFNHEYQVYDVTKKLNVQKPNVIGAWLSEGWWSGNITFIGKNWNYFGDRQSLLAKLVVTYADGSTAEINTEPNTWKVFHGGPIRYGSFFQGEVYDARLERSINGWSSASYDDSKWQPAHVVELADSASISSEAGVVPQNKELITGYQNMNLIGQKGNQPKVIDELTAKSVNEVRPGVFIYDMGQNMVGFPKIDFVGATPGKPIILRYAEVKYPDLPEHQGLAGTMMMENIRAALTHDTYFPIAEQGTITPRFTFHGYRFIEITGISKALPLASVKGRVVSSVTELTANYETSNPLVNKLWKNITWSMKGNFLSIPTDTPARNERMGWSGDLNVFARTASYLADINPFIDRHMMSMRDLQGENGRFTDIAPVGHGWGGILWGSAGINVPWEMYLQYGDTNLLKTQYASMKKYMAYLNTRIDAKTGVLPEGPLGDWLSPEGGKNDDTLVWESYHVYLLDVMARVAGILGENADQANFAQQYKQRKEFFNKTYVNPKTGVTVKSGVIAGYSTQYAPETKGQIIDTQASYAIPIAMNVFDEKNMPLAKKNLAKTIERKNTDDKGVVRPEFSLMTGFIGTSSLMDAISLSNRNDLAYKVLQNTAYPSWLYSIENGSTTIWERLNSYTVQEGFGGNNSMNSFNHYSFGAVGSWMISHSLGIQRDISSPGFKHFILQPKPDPTGKMLWAKGHYDSMYGRIKSEWNIKGDSTTYTFVVPENSSARLYLQSKSKDSIRNLSDKSNRAEFIGFVNGVATYNLTSGEYTFSIKR